MKVERAADCLREASSIFPNLVLKPSIVPSIHLKKISKRYPNGSIGLSPTDLSVDDGTCFVLLGPSGSGKSTLLRLISGLESPDSGTLEIDGVRSENLPPHRRGVSLVSQRPTLYPHLDVAENLAISLRFEQSNIRRKSRISQVEIDQRVRESAELLGLSQCLKHRSHELSGGQQRRVVLGRAIVARRKIWLLDEPFSQLDSPLRDHLCRELHLLRRQLGITIILVTHDPNEAIALADRIGVLGNGRLLQTGKPEEVLTHPSNRTVAFCFGCPPINLIDGTVEQDAGGKVFVSPGRLCRMALPDSMPCGEPLTLGIRPEDLRIARGENGVLVCRGLVIGSHPFAGSWLTDVQLGIGLVRTLGPAKVLEELVELWVDPEKMHYFNGVDGRRIS